MTEENEDLAPNTEVDIPAPSFASEDQKKEEKSPEPEQEMKKSTLPPVETPTAEMPSITQAQYDEMVGEKLIVGEASSTHGKVVSLKNGTKVYLPYR